MHAYRKLTGQHRPSHIRAAKRFYRSESGMTAGSDLILGGA